MNQPKQILENNGKIYFVSSEKYNIQWFVVKGMQLYPNLSITYLETLGRMWYNQNNLEVGYKMTKTQCDQCTCIIDNLFEKKCHPIG